jgi:hypothetical protein
MRASGVAANAALLDELAPVWRNDLARLLPEVVASGPPAHAHNPLRLFESVAHLLERLAVRRPLLLVLEDLHWADEMTLRLLAFVVRRVRLWRALLIATARDDEGPTRRRPTASSKRWSRSRAWTRWCCARCRATTRGASHMRWSVPGPSRTSRRKMHFWLAEAEAELNELRR